MPVWLLLLSLAVPAADSASYRDGPTAEAYTLREIEGWQVRVNNELLKEDSEMGEKALQLMRVQLYQIKLLVPHTAVESLQKVPIWLDMRPDATAQYHPDQGWLESNGYNIDKTKCVDISNAKRFIDVYAEQPYVLLHELAHAFHDRVLGFDNERVREVYEKAKQSNRYDSVLRQPNRRVKHYGMTNHKEYFAESTEAFFGTNDFYPFVRAELKEFDPDMYQLLQELWHNPAQK